MTSKVTSIPMQRHSNYEGVSTKVAQLIAEYPGLTHAHIDCVKADATGVRVECTLSVELRIIFEDEPYYVEKNLDGDLVWVIHTSACIVELVLRDSNKTIEL